MLNPRDTEKFPNLLPGHISTHHRHLSTDTVQVASALKWGWTRNSIRPPHKDALCCPQNLSSNQVGQLLKKGGTLISLDNAGVCNGTWIVGIVNTPERLKFIVYIGW